jgi:preprotein translocase subunit SecG
MMSTEPQESELKEYAGGWITERKDSEIPGFLKLAYPVIVAAMLVYLVLFMNGEVNHSTRGIYVQQLNAVTGNANIFMYIVGAMIVVYAVILIAFVLGKQKHEE